MSDFIIRSILKLRHSYNVRIDFDKRKSKNIGFSLRTLIEYITFKIKQYSCDVWNCIVSVYRMHCQGLVLHAAVDLTTVCKPFIIGTRVVLVCSFLCAFIPPVKFREFALITMLRRILFYNYSIYFDVLCHCVSGHFNDNVAFRSWGR